MYHNFHVCTVTGYSFSCYSVLNESGANSRTWHAYRTAQTLHQHTQKVWTLETPLTNYQNCSSRIRKLVTLEGCRKHPVNFVHPDQNSTLRNWKAGYQSRPYCHPRKIFETQHMHTSCWLIEQPTHLQDVSIHQICKHRDQISATFSSVERTEKTPYKEDVMKETKAEQRKQGSRNQMQRKCKINCGYLPSEAFTFQWCSQQIPSCSCPHQSLHRRHRCCTEQNPHALENIHVTPKPPTFKSTFRFTNLRFSQVMTRTEEPRSSQYRLPKNTSDYK